MYGFLIITFLSISLSVFFSFGNRVCLRDVRLSLGDRVATFLGKSCQLCLPSVHYVAASLCLPAFPFGVNGFMWILFCLFLSSLIYFI